MIEMPVFFASVCAMLSITCISVVLAENLFRDGYDAKDMILLGIFLVLWSIAALLAAILLQLSSLKIA